MDTRKQLAAVLAQIQSDIDASARKLRRIASEAESLGFLATAILADDAAAAAVDFAESFAVTYRPDSVALANKIAIHQAISVAMGETKPTPPYVTPEALAAMSPATQPQAKQPTFSLLALLGIK